MHLQTTYNYQKPSQVINQKQIFLHNQQQTNVYMPDDTEKQYTSWDNYNGQLMNICWLVHQGIQYLICGIPSQIGGGRKKGGQKIAIEIIRLSF